MCKNHGGAIPAVARKARERLADIIDPDRVLRTTAALAFADITQLYDEDYQLKPIKDWPDDLRQAVKRIEPRLANVDPGDGAADKVLRVELHDKFRPLELLAKHLGLTTERVEHSGTLEVKWIE